MPGMFMSRLGRVDELGRLYTLTGAPPSGSNFIGGSVVGPVGSSIVDAVNPPVLVENGKPLSAAGLLCVEEGGVIATMEGGIPLSATRRVCVTSVAPTTSSDTFIAKLRINTAQQIHIVNVAPPVFSSYTNGFSNGFGI